MCPTPAAPRKGPGARPGLLNQNAAEGEAQEPAGQASGSPDLAHTRALLPQRAALGSPGTAAHRTFFHSSKWPSAWVTAQSTAVGPHPQGTWVLRGSDRALRKRWVLRTLPGPGNERRGHHGPHGQDRLTEHLLGCDCLGGQHGNSCPLRDAGPSPPFSISPPRPCDLQGKAWR